MNNILEVKNLCKKYDGFELRNINLELPKGMIMGLIGENCVGKGRIQIFLIAGIVSLLFGGLFFFVQQININFAIMDMINVINNFLPIIFLLATIIIYYISFKTSYKIYSKKEI